MQDDRANRPFTTAAAAPEAMQAENGMPCRALTVVTPAAAAPTAHRTLPRSAPFLAQLIATRLDLPATRARRRANPEAAAGLYRRAAALR